MRPPFWEQKEEIVKEANNTKKKRERGTEKYLTCPRCGALVPYYRRLGHSCFRSHLMEIERDLARFGKTISMW